MSNPGGSVEVRITGTLDPSLASSVKAADSQISALGSTTTVSAGKMAEALRAVGGDVTKITPAMLGLGAAGTAATAEVAAGAEVATVATGGLRVATSGAIQEYVRLGHEAMTGNFSRMPGSAIVLASRMGGLTLATLGTVAAYATLGAVAAVPAISLGLLAYRQIEAAKNAQALATGFQLSGRGAIYSAQGVAGLVDMLSNLGTTGTKAATALVQFDATHANLNSTLAIAADQLAPAYVREFGEKAPTALNTLKAKLNEIATAAIPQSIHEFEQLNQTTLKLPSSSVPAIEAMIRSGNGLGAAMQIVTAEGQRTGTNIESLGQLIKQATSDLSSQKNELDTLKAAMRAAGADGAVIFAADVGKAEAQVELLTGRLQLLKGVLAAPSSSSSGPKDLSEQDRYVAQLRVEAELAHESAQQRHVDAALIATATAHLRDQGKAEQEVVHSAAEARKILGDQADAIAKTAAAGYVAPKGPNIPKQDQHIGDDIAAAYRQANDLRIENDEETNSFLLQQGQITADAFLAQARTLENQRLNVELTALAARENADKNDRVAFAKDEADKAVVVQESTTRRPAPQKS